MYESFVTHLNEIVENKSPGLDDLKYIGAWIQKVAQNSDEAKLMAGNDDLMTSIKNCIVRSSRHLSTYNVFEDPNLIMRLRITRAIVILVRNLAPFNKADHEHTIKPLCDLTHTILSIDGYQESPYTLKTIVSIMQCMCNLFTSGAGVKPSEITYLTNVITEICNSKFTDCDDYRQLWEALLRETMLATEQDSFINQWISENYNGFTGFVLKNRLIRESYGWNKKEDERLEPSTINLLGLKTLLNVATAPSFYNTICKLETSDDLLSLQELLGAAAVMAGSKDNGWSKEQKLNISSWVIEYIRLLTRRVSVGDINETLPTYEKRLSTTLDLVSSLLRFPGMIKLFDSYELFPLILDLFVVACGKKKRGKFDEAQSKDFDDSTDKSSVKCILVEIISYFVAGNYDNQELVRNKHCMELVLDCCNLDLEEPFIRERSILCIRSLLENNRGNQDFIANLEVKGAKVDDKSRKILDQCGYRVKIVDGKVKLVAKVEDIEED